MQKESMSAYRKPWKTGRKINGKTWDGCYGVEFQVTPYTPRYGENWIGTSWNKDSLWSKPLRRLMGHKGKTLRNHRNGN